MHDDVYASGGVSCDYGGVELAGGDGIGDDGGIGGGDDYPGFPWGWWRLIEVEILRVCVEELGRILNKLSKDVWEQSAEHKYPPILNLARQI